MLALAENPNPAQSPATTAFQALKKLPKRIPLLILCLILPTLLGCQQITGSGVVHVIGEARMDRKPLADTMVAFIPLKFRNSSGKIREIAFGKTDDTGRFELHTSDTKGVFPTEYRVLFFRPALKEDNVKNAPASLQPEEDTEAVAWLKDVLDRTELRPRRSMQISELEVGDIPATYNIESTLRYDVKLGAGILYPKFNLDSHPEI